VQSIETFAHGPWSHPGALTTGGEGDEVQYVNGQPVQQRRTAGDERRAKPAENLSTRFVRRLRHFMTNASGRNAATMVSTPPSFSEALKS
jgi:hypothetical protein